MKPLITLILPTLLLSLLVPPPIARGCAFFLIARDGVVLAANNEDYLDPDTRMWFVVGEGAEFGRVYFGFGNRFTQGGMNEVGLFFDGAATRAKPSKIGEGKDAYAGNPLDEMMATCGTTAEAVAFLRRFDLSTLWERAQLQIADATGASAIVEGDQVLWKEGDHQITTNFYQSEVGEDQPCPCVRYKMIEEILRTCGTPTVEVCRRALATVHQEGEVSTVYSNVYDLVHQKITLWHFHDWDHPMEIDLHAELAKGPHEVVLSEVFPATFAFRSFQQRYEARQKGR